MTGKLLLLPARWKTEKLPLHSSWRGIRLGMTTENLVVDTNLGFFNHPVFLEQYVTLYYHIHQWPSTTTSTSGSVLGKQEFLYQPIVQGLFLTIPGLCLTISGLCLTISGLCPTISGLCLTIPSLCLTISNLRSVSNNLWSLSNNLQSVSNNLRSVSNNLWSVFNREKRIESKEPIY